MRNILCTVILMCMCGNATAQSDFPYPHIPDSITVNHERLTWMLDNFWQRFNFNDESNDNLNVGEQGFVDFINLLGEADSLQTANAAGLFIDAVMLHSHSATMQKHFMELSEHYLANPDSPLRNDRIHAAVTEARAALPDSVITPAERSKLLSRCKILRLNMPGMKANNFRFAMADSDEEEQLYNINATYLLLCFFDPECERCSETLKEMARCEVLERDNIRILCICTEDMTTTGRDNQYRNVCAHLPEKWTVGCVLGGALAERELYWFDQMPSLYLLDKEKRVILKDASLHIIKTKLTDCPQ